VGASAIKGKGFFKGFKGCWGADRNVRIMMKKKEKMSMSCKLALFGGMFCKW
jgi:hypothetical protein